MFKVEAFVVEKYEGSAVVGFNCSINNNHLFSFRPERGLKPDAWNGLIQACRTGNLSQLDWYPSNGEFRITADGNNVAFDVAKYGDGSVSIIIPANDCLSAFIKAKELSE